MSPSRLRKIKALAERGIGGEKENAQKMFDSHRVRVEATTLKAPPARIKTHGVIRVNVALAKHYARLFRQEISK